VSAAVVAIIIIAIFGFIYIGASIRIVRPYQRGVKERLGKYNATLDHGLRLVIPLVDKIRMVDMREQVVDVPPQEVITEDNVSTSVDAVIYYEPTDPQRLVYNVANFILAVTKLAQTNLRNVIGDMDLDEALTSRDKVNVALRQILDDATDKWGVRVVRVEIQRIDPPPDVMSAMHEQMKAERTRRAVVLEADGAREAAIARAEGEKRSAILSAEGVREAQVLQAQGEAQAIKSVAEAEQYRQQVVAEGQADAIRSVYQAIHDGRPTDDLIAIKYLETLGDIADGRATKIFLPAEMSGVMGSLAGVAELFNGDAPNGRGPEPTDGSDERNAERHADPTSSSGTKPRPKLSSATKVDTTTPIDTGSVPEWVTAPNDPSRPPPPTR
jgi:regulator of protease activity HflC (stomatin/prohibitin superfamily)